MTAIDVTNSSLRPRTPARPPKAAKKDTKPGGISVERVFTKPGVDVFDTCEWDTRSAIITNERGEIVFEQKDVEMPKFWSQMATNVVVSKYFRGHLGTADRETSVRQLIGRVVRTMTQWGREGGYFAREEDGDAFRDELTHILLYQMASFNSPGGAYDSVQFQNANHSVRVTDDFMRAYEKGGDWETRAVTDRNRVMARFKARDLMRKMAESAWVCGDPGMQFDTTVNEWHPCPNTARINASNPCSEYMFLDDSACNLASLNLMRFYTDANGFDVEAYRHALRIVITAQEIVVDFASYPTPAIEKNSHAFRPLGIGYANLGALLMARGLPYDSEEGREYAAAITSILSGESYAQSARISEKLGPFAGYAVNREPFLRVIDKHRRAAYRINTRPLPADLADAAAKVWDEAYALGQEHGYRNAQISVLAPTGTIAFMMDCDTTGIEPDIALVKYKKLVGGGMLKIVNQTVPTALKRLGYDAKQINEITQYIDENDTIEGAAHILDAHLTVFDCAFKAQNGTRSIHYMGHLKMMGAVQPFISGAISKTINMPSAASVDEIELAYHEAWKLGLKAVAVYRDGCKRSQPLSTGKDKEKLTDLGVTPTAVRRKLPDERESITHKFSISGHEGYITVGKYEDGTPGEIFITMAKEGSTISGLMDSFATMTSLALQHGVPLNFLVDKFTHTRFEPSGFTKNPEIPMTKSIMDYIFKWLATKFLDRESQAHAGVILREDAAPVVTKPVPNVAPLTKEDASFVTSLATSSVIAAPKDADGPNTRNTATFRYQQDAPSCSDCGSIMVRNGACYKCLNCGSTSGCS